MKASLMYDNPALTHSATAVSAAFAVGSWVSAFDMWVRLVAGCVAILAGLFSIYTNAKK